MTAAAPSTALVTIQPAFTGAERLAGYLAGYRGLTREARARDLRQFTTWCRARCVALFAVRRAGIESFARDLEARGGPGPGPRAPDADHHPQGGKVVTIPLAPCTAPHAAARVHHRRA